MRDLLKALFEFGGGVVSFVLAVAVIIAGYTLFSLAMGIVTWEYYVGWLAIVVLVGGGWLTLGGNGFVGKPFMIIAVITLLGISIRHRASGVATYVATAVAEANRDAMIAAAKVSQGQEFQCDRTTPDIKLFAYVDKKKLSIAWTLMKNGRFICFTRPGVNPLTGEMRLQVDDVLAKAILEQEPPPTPSPPIPVPRPAPTPVPEIGDRPVPTPIPEVGVRPVP